MRFKEEFYKIIEAHHEAPTIDRSKRHVGIIMTVAAYLFYALYTIFFQVDAFKYNVAHSFYSIFFQFSIINFVMLLSYTLFSIEEDKGYFICKRPFYVVLRAVIEIPLMLCYSLARIWTPHVDNSILYSTDIFWMVVILFFCRVKTSKALWFGVLFGMVGIIYIYSFDISSFHDLIGGIFGTISGILVALIIFLTRFLIKKDPALRLCFYNALVNFIFFSLGTVILGLFNGFELPNLSATVIMLFSGFIWAIALFFFIEALNYAENYLIASIALFLPIFVELFNWINTETIVSSSTIFGSLLMIVGAVVIITHSYKQRQHKGSYEQY